MKVVILAGGLGTRLAEETDVRPKPMVEIGDRPILRHIMDRYAGYGFRDFVIALGYKGEVIRRYVAERSCPTGGDGDTSTDPIADWNVELVDTGLHTKTGGRAKRLAPYVGQETFMLTYGDGVADIDLRALLAFHRSHGRLATITAVRPPARFGKIDLRGDRVTRFEEKPQHDEGWINGGFFVLEPRVLEYVPGDATEWEGEPLERLAAEGELMAYQHSSFWQCMDTLRDKRLLERLWSDGDAPWRAGCP